MSDEAKSASFVMPGVGGRVGANLKVSSTFVVRPSVDMLGLSRRTKLVAGDEVVADQPPVLISGHVAAGWEF